MNITRRAAVVGTGVFALPFSALAQDQILSPEATVDLEHEDRAERLRRSVARLGVTPPPRFSTVRVPAERMPENFRVSVPILRVAFAERTFFDTAQSIILPTGLQAVAAVAEAVRGEAPDAAVFVAGHTDSQGSEDYNHNLSVRRANAVSDALYSIGVGEAALWRVGFGESVPLYANDTEEMRSFNRRVEFLFGARVEPVVDVLSRQSANICVADSETDSARCRRERPRRTTFEATQRTRRHVGVGLDGRARPAGLAGASGRGAPTARPRAGVAASVPLTLSIPLLQGVTIAAPVR